MGDSRHLFGNQRCRAGGQDFSVVRRDRAIWSDDVSCADGVWWRRAWSQESSLELELLRGDLS